MAKYEIELNEEVLRETGLQIYQDLCRLGEEHGEDKFMAEILEKILEIEFGGTIPMGYGTEKVKQIYYDKVEGSEGEIK
jgi:hypothetical protein